MRGDGSMVRSRRMVVVGLTGSIGSGKSTVSAMLAARGAVVVDADKTYAELIRPGAPLVGALAERFGAGILTDDGHVDRPALAAIVFDDSAALADLNALTHPAIGADILRQLSELGETDAFVILDLPLLVEGGRYPMAGLVVVDCPPDLALERLVALRGMDPDDAARRMAVQATREDRLARADFVVDNSGDLAHLEAEVDRCWTWIQTLAPAP